MFRVLRPAEDMADKYVVETYGSVGRRTMPPLVDKTDIDKEDIGVSSLPTYTPETARTFLQERFAERRLNVFQPIEMDAWEGDDDMIVRNLAYYWLWKFHGPTPSRPIVRSKNSHDLDEQAVFRSAKIAAHAAMQHEVSPDQLAWVALLLSWSVVGAAIISSFNEYQTWSMLLLLVASLTWRVSVQACEIVEQNFLVNMSQDAKHDLDESARAAMLGMLLVIQPFSGIFVAILALWDEETLPKRAVRNMFCKCSLICQALCFVAVAIRTESLTPVAILSGACAVYAMF